MGEARALLARDFGPALAEQALRITASERRSSAVLEGGLGLLIGGAMMAAGAGLLFVYSRYYSHHYRPGNGRTLGLAGMLLSGGLAVIVRTVLRRG
jgi:hypothetical protein